MYWQSFGLYCIGMNWSDEESLNGYNDVLVGLGQIIGKLLKSNIRAPNSCGIASRQQSKSIDNAVSISNQHTSYVTWGCLLVSELP
jgi:hypothetical protein